MLPFVTNWSLKIDNTIQIAQCLSANMIINYCFSFYQYSISTITFDDTITRPSPETTLVYEGYKIGVVAGRRVTCLILVCLLAASKKTLPVKITNWNDIRTICCSQGCSYPMPNTCHYEKRKRNIKIKEMKRYKGIIKGAVCGCLVPVLKTESEIFCYRAESQFMSI